MTRLSNAQRDLIEKTQGKLDSLGKEAKGQDEETVKQKSKEAKALIIDAKNQNIETIKKLARDDETKEAFSDDNTFLYAIRHFDSSLKVPETLNPEFREDAVTSGFMSERLDEVNDRAKTLKRSTGKFIESRVKLYNAPETDLKGKQKAANQAKYASRQALVDHTYTATHSGLDPKLAVDQIKNFNIYLPKEHPNDFVEADEDILMSGAFLWCATCINKGSVE